MRCRLVIKGLKAGDAPRRVYEGIHPSQRSAIELFAARQFDYPQYARVQGYLYTNSPCFKYVCLTVARNGRVYQTGIPIDEGIRPRILDGNPDYIAPLGEGDLAPVRGLIGTANPRKLRGTFPAAPLMNR